MVPRAAGGWVSFLPTMLVTIRITIVIRYGAISIMFLNACKLGIYVAIVDNILNIIAPNMLNVGFHIVKITRAIASQPLTSIEALAESSEKPL